MPDQHSHPSGILRFAPLPPENCDLWAARNGIPANAPGPLYAGPSTSLEEVAKLFGAMALLVLADDLAGLGIQRSKQAGGAVPRIVVGAAFDLPRSHGQQRSRAVKRLDLALFIHA